MELNDLDGRWAFITDDWPFDICGILDDGTYMQISQFQEPWDGNEVTIRVGTKKIDLRDRWSGDLYLCGQLERPSDSILEIKDMVDFIKRQIGLVLIPDPLLTEVYKTAPIDRSGQTKTLLLKVAHDLKSLKKLESAFQTKKYAEIKEKMIAYRFDKFCIDPGSPLNNFD